MTFISALRSRLFQATAAHPRILFLHGFTRSGAAFSAQSQVLQSALKVALDPSTVFHFPNGTIRLNPREEDEDPEYAWWRADDDTGELVGLPETMRFLGNFLDFHGPFDGVVGFSQGACLAAMLSSALEKDHSKQVRELMVTDHPPMKFCVALSGFRPKASMYDEFYYPMIETPVLSVIGKEDNVVPEERSMALAGRCEAGKVVYHGRHHVVPRDEETVEEIVRFVAQFMQDRGEERPKL